jgi:hypothetical protein
MNNNKNTVWVFHGERAQFTSAIFTSFNLANIWIKNNKVSGILTEYPVNISCFEWAIENKYYIAKENDKRSNKIQKFTSHAQKHFHYYNGIIER